MQSAFHPTRLLLIGIGMAMVLSGSVAPAARTPDAPPVRTDDAAGSAVAEYERAADGLFYVTGRINGHDIRFLVDTGASVVTLTREDAATIGVDPQREAFRSPVRTANGAATMAWTTLPTIDIAGHRVSGIDAAVPRAGLPVSLLGQNLLRKLGMVTIDGDRLRVHSRALTLS